MQVLPSWTSRRANARCIDANVCKGEIEMYSVTQQNAKRKSQIIITKQCQPIFFKKIVASLELLSTFFLSFFRFSPFAWREQRFDSRVRRVVRPYWHSSRNRPDVHSSPKRINFFVFFVVVVFIQAEQNYIVFLKKIKKKSNQQSTKQTNKQHCYTRTRRWMTSSSFSTSTSSQPLSSSSSSSSGSSSIVSNSVVSLSSASVSSSSSLSASCSANTRRKRRRNRRCNSLL